MSEVPEYLHEYSEIIHDLKDTSNLDKSSGDISPGLSTDDIARNLMCDLWKYLKDNPDYNISVRNNHAVCI